MSAVMFDTDFTSAIIRPAPKTQPQYDEWLAVQQIAKTTAGSQDILLSAAVWFELQAFVLPDGSTLADRINAAMTIVVEEIDAKIVNKAGEILRHHRKAPKYCHRCLAIDHDKQCTQCGRLGSRLNKTTDALIVAHAECIPRVTALYTLDDGPVHLASHLKSTHLVVTKPGNPHGILFGGPPPALPAGAAAAPPATPAPAATTPTTAAPIAAAPAPGAPAKATKK